MSGPQVDHEKFPNPSGSDKTFPVKGSAGYKEANPLPEDNPDIKAMERMGVGVTPDNKTNEESKPNNVGVSAFNLGSRSAAMIDEDVAVAIPELSDPRPLDLNPNKIQPVQETKNILRDAFSSVVQKKENIHVEKPNKDDFPASLRSL